MPTAYYITDKSGSGYAAISGKFKKVSYKNQKNTVQTIKSGPGVIGGYFLYNPSTTETAHVQVFDKTGTITLGSTVPDLRFPLRPQATANLTIPNGILMTNAIKFAVTKTEDAADANATGITATWWYD